MTPSSLQGIGPPAVGRVAQLTACIPHPEPTVRDAVTDALGSIGPEARAALPALLAQDAAPELRAAAATALGHVGSVHEDTAVILQLVSDADWTVRCDAHYAVARWSTPPPELVQAVAWDLENVDGCDGQPHAAALQALTAWGEFAAPAVPAIAGWIASCANEASDLRDYDLGTIAALVEALGGQDAALRNSVERLVAAYMMPTTVDTAGDAPEERPVETEASCLERRATRMCRRVACRAGHRRSREPSPGTRDGTNRAAGHRSSALRDAMERQAYGSHP